MKVRKAKAILALCLSMTLAMPSGVWASVATEGDIGDITPQSEASQQEEAVIGDEYVEEQVDDVAVPDPYYEFTFDKGVTDNQVENEGSKTGITATITGEGTGLGVVEDNQRGNNVLNLPGGDDLNQGCLTLPEDMFADVTSAGFAFSFWIDIDSEAAQYSRIFSASSIAMNSEGWPFNAPEFTFVVGSETSSDMQAGSSGYNSSIMLPDRSNQLKLVWDQQFAKGKWQHVTVSVSPSSYDVYLDGEQIGMLYDRNNNTASILTQMFADDAAILKAYTYNVIGRSVYNTDNDIKAKMDEFRFYNTALTAEQAKAAYDSYAVGGTVMEQLQQEIAAAEALSISFYTRTTYDALQDKIAEAKEVVDNPVTEANVQRVTGELQDAEKAMVFYEGIDASTTFSNAQLTEEAKTARTTLANGGLSTDSNNQLKAAVEKADEALKDTNKEQAVVDDALKAIRKAMDNLDYGSTLHFDASPENTLGEIFHGSTGFLYGVSEVNVPSSELISAIQPKILVQKAADGQQHPSGDGYRLTSYLDECGVENIQIYLQDYYLEWPYEYNGIDDYNGKVKNIVTKMLEGKSQEEVEKYSFVIFNEPDGIWYGSDVTRLCNDWLTIYNTIKSISPYAKVAGPNYAGYSQSAYRTFFNFCRTNDCLPDYITWHELSKGSLTAFKSHCAEVKQMVKTYYANSSIEPKLFVNETVNFDDIGNPGALVNWLSIFDEEDVYASLPYWGLANSLNELAADSNKPNGAWWVYKWYAQMTGMKTPLTMEKIEDPSAYGRLYGFTTVDDSANVIHSLFGGQAGAQNVSIEKITSTETFKNASSAHVKIYSTKFTGHQGFADETPVEFEGNVAFTGDNLVFTIPDAELMDAYYAVITPATSETTTDISEYEKNWEETYEAENATLLGGATAYTKTGGSDLARSNRAEVGGLNSESDGVEFHVEVPRDGRYRLNIYYSNQAPQVDPLSLEYVTTGGQNRAIGSLVTHALSIDGGAAQDVIYDSTVKWGYYNYKTVYVDLTQGTHTIRLMHKGENQNSKEVNSMLCALLDKIDLEYAPDELASVVIEPEELVSTQSGYALKLGETYTGKGAAEGSGDFTFYVNAPREGYYTVNFVGSGSAVLSKSRLNYAADARAETEVQLGWQKLYTLTPESNGNVYLTAGMNAFKLEGNGMILDQISFTEAANQNLAVIEAENCILAGTDVADNYNYLPGSTAVPTVVSSTQASGGKVVEGFRGGQDNSLTFTVNAQTAGTYKLSVCYANDEPAPVMKTQSGSNYVHPYNTDLVERYAQIQVNGGTAQTVYFRNTFCWETYKNTVVDVDLQAGENIITLTNDNSYKFSSVQDDFTPRFDKFVVAPYVDGVAQEVEPTPTPTLTPTPTETPVQKLANPMILSKTKMTKAYKKNGTFTIKPSKAQGTVTFTSSSKKVATVGKTSGKVTIKGCGKTTITVKAAGNSKYKAVTKKVTVTVNPKKATLKSAKSQKKKTITVKWNRDSAVSGYQIQYSTRSSFKGPKVKKITKNKTVSTVLKNLKAGKKYYVRIRSYKKVNGKTYYGAWSKKKSVKTRK